MIVWGRPLWLLAVAIVAALAGFEHARSRTGARGIAVRAFIGCLVALALTEPSYLTETDAFVDVALVDRSASIAPDELARALREATELGSDALVLFDETAAVAPPPPTAISPQGERSDLVAGLALAGSLVPLDRPGRIVVWTDGRSATRTWPDLARLTVETRALQPRRDGPAILYATTERTEVAPGGPSSSTRRSARAASSRSAAGTAHSRNGTSMQATCRWPFRSRRTRRRVRCRWSSSSPAPSRRFLSS